MKFARILLFCVHQLKSQSCRYTHKVTVSLSPYSYLSLFSLSAYISGDLYDSSLYPYIALIFWAFSYSLFFSYTISLKIWRPKHCLPPCSGPLHMNCLVNWIKWRIQYIQNQTHSATEPSLGWTESRWRYTQIYWKQNCQGTRCARLASLIRCPAGRFRNMPTQQAGGRLGKQR